MKWGTRSSALALVVGGVLLADAPAARSADAPSPPGRDGFSEHVLDGRRLRVGPRAAARAPDGTLHVVYGESLLRHAWNSGSGWQTETLDATHGRGIGAALAFDAAGDLHVAYGDALRGELFHGEKSGAAWTSRLVAQGLETKDPEPAIGVSGDGVVHVAWLDDYEVALQYADDASGAFQTTTLATDGGYGSDLDLAVAPDGTPHVVFMSVGPFQQGVPGNGPRAMVHLERTASGWSREDLEAGSDVGGSPVGGAASCAFAPDGTLHAIFDGTSTLTSPVPLRHARRTASGWETETIAAIPAHHSHIAFDASGKLYVGILSGENGFVGRLGMGTWGDWSFLVPPATAPTAAFAREGTTFHFPYQDLSGSIVVQGYTLGASFPTKTTLDTGSEPLLTPSIAADAAGRARIAVVRPDASGPRIEVLRSSGSAWDLTVAATGVSTAAVPSLRVAPDGSSSVAFATEAGHIVCASDAGGTWTTETAATGLGRPVNARIAQAIAPDGTRRVLWTELYDAHIQIAREDANGWTVSEVASSPGMYNPIDAEVASDGVTHVVWLNAGSILHASDAGGTWTSETVGPAEGGWGTSNALDLAISPQDDLWVAFSIPWQFFDFANAYTDRGGAWTAVSLGHGDSLSVGFLPDGSARAVGWESGVVRHRESAPQWQQEVLDAGPGGGRQFDDGLSSLTEGDAPSLLGVAPQMPANGSRVSKFAGTVDAAGVCHAAYVDSATGDLRYATDRDPGRATTGSVEIVRGPGSVDDADASFVPGIVRFGNGDSGTKFVTLTVAQDAEDEPQEELVLELANPVGAALGAVARHTLRILDDDPTPPPTEPENLGRYFLPTKARAAADGSINAHGVLHLGTRPLISGGGPFVVTWGERRIDVPSLRQRREGVYTWSNGSAALSLRREQGSATRFRFDLRVPPGEPGAAGPLEVSLSYPGVTASSTVHLVRGRLDLARGEGWFDAPALHLEALHGTFGDPGTIALAANLQGLGARPDAAPRVWITVGDLFTKEIDPAAFREDGVRWVARSRGERVTLDYGRGTVTARFDDAPVALPPVGSSSADVQIRVLAGSRDVTRTLSTVITTKDGRFRN